MLFRSPDGKRATWQFPMVAYAGRFSGIGPGGAIQLTDRSGRRGQFTFATNARITVNGKAADRNHLPAGALATARALCLAPTEITVLDLTR